MPPLINVSMALMSPMLADGFSVIRRQQTVGTNGRVTFTTNTIRISTVPSTRRARTILSGFPTFR